MKTEALIAPYQNANQACLQLGAILLNDKLVEKAPVNLVLKSLNRHGLIAGATGSGKTKTIQVLAEQLSLAGIPSLLMDIKGDVSGLGAPGIETQSLKERNLEMQLEFKPQGFACEIMTLDDTDPGIPLRTTLHQMGPLLFSRMLQLNDTQAGVLTILFEYAKSKQLALIDLTDLKKLLQFAQTDQGNAELAQQFGAVASSSLGILMRKIIELEAQDGASIFGEPAFQVQDLLRTNNKQEGIISILRLMDMQDKPKVFSTYMLSLLSDIYRSMPEAGDLDKPKLVLFIDEAHLIFKEASPALLSLLETTVKLIRSKGVGLIFCTQTPNDVPDAILGQLGLKIQHALRAFTAKDRKNMHLVAQNFPATEFYNTESLLTTLGIGEALVTALDAKGMPTPLVHCRVRAPLSRMGVLENSELQAILAQSSLYNKYAKKSNQTSAKDKLAQPNQETSPSPKEQANTPNVIETLSKNTLVRQLVRGFFRELINVLFKALGLKKR